MKSKQKERKPAESGQSLRKAKPCQFTLLPEEIEQIEGLRFRYQKIALAHKDEPVDIVKSEIVRAGLQALLLQSDAQFYKTIEKLEVLNEGRPAKAKTS